jgi:hypothetical protein
MIAKRSHGKVAVHSPVQMIVEEAGRYLIHVELKQQDESEDYDG